MNCFGDEKEKSARHNKFLLLKISHLWSKTHTYEVYNILHTYFKNLFILFIFMFGCVGSSLLHAGFLKLRQAGVTLCCGGRASHCGGFSWCGARALGSRASVVVARVLSSCGSWALECRLRSCGTLA